MSTANAELRRPTGIGCSELLGDWPFELICNLLIKHLLPTLAVKLFERRSTPRTIPHARAAIQRHATVHASLQRLAETCVSASLQRSKANVKRWLFRRAWNRRQNINEKPAFVPLTVNRLKSLAAPFHKSAKSPNVQAQPPPLSVTPKCNPDNRIS